MQYICGEMLVKGPSQINLSFTTEHIHIHTCFQRGVHLTIIHFDKTSENVRLLLFSC